MADEPRRYTFHDELVAMLGSGNVYFQPPESVKMKYPAVVYNRRSGDTDFADNGRYKWTQSYDVTVIAADPDFIDTLDVSGHFPMCRSDRHFVADNLNHDVFVIYF